MEPFRGWLYDGATAARHDVEVSVTGADSLLIVGTGGERSEVPRSSLFHVDSRVGWRDYWLDWLFAAAAILFYTAGGWYVARQMGAGAPFAVLLPQLAASVFAYPLVARLVVGLDRWRLAR